MNVRLGAHFFHPVDLELHFDDALLHFSQPLSRGSIRNELPKMSADADSSSDAIISRLRRVCTALKSVHVIPTLTMDYGLLRGVVQALFRWWNGDRRV